MKSYKFYYFLLFLYIFFFQAEDGIRDYDVTGVQTCALPILVFVEKLKKLSEDSHNDFPDASEACLSAVRLLSQVQERIEKLETINDLELQDFLETRIKIGRASCRERV